MGSIIYTDLHKYLLQLMGYMRSYDKLFCVVIAMNIFHNNCFTFVQSVLEIHLYINKEKEI